MKIKAKSAQEADFALVYKISYDIHYWVHSFNGKTTLSKRVVPRSSRGGPAVIPLEIF